MQVHHTFLSANFDIISDKKMSVRDISPAQLAGVIGTYFELRACGAF